MFTTIKTLFHEVLTDSKGAYCPVRCIAASGALVLCGSSIARLVMTHQFDAVSFGSGIAAIATATGAGSGLKSKLNGDG